MTDVLAADAGASEPADRAAQLWRAACEDFELASVLPVFARVLALDVPLDGLAVLLWEKEASRLTTVAQAGASAGHPPDRARTAQPIAVAAPDTAWLTQFIQSGVACWGDALPAGVSTWLLKGVSPTAAWCAPLGAHAEASGLAVVVLQRPLFAERLAFGAYAREAVAGVLEASIAPLQVALRNHQHFHDVERRREALRADREALLSRLGRHDICEVIIGEHDGLRPVMQAVEQVTHTDAPVLILGETGSGKEVVARAIHERSHRANGPVVRINCGAIPTELIDSELFGHERGSFTGAVATRKGWFERADGGTLFLDEVGELPSAAQVRLLRVLQDGTLERVGGHQTIRVDVRLVAATHRDLDEMVTQGAFRQDLWYRLSVFPLRLPALRQRLEDLPALATHFAERAGRRLGGHRLSPTEQDIELLRAYAWPGNVRELAAVIERAAILGGGRGLEIAAALGTQVGRSVPAGPAAVLPGAVLPALSPKTGKTDRETLCSLDEAIKAHIERALAACQGRIEGPHGAAKLLEVNPHTLRARMRKLGVTWSHYRPRELH